MSAHWTSFRQGRETRPRLVPDPERRIGADEGGHSWALAKGQPGYRVCRRCGTLRDEKRGNKVCRFRSFLF